MVELLSNHRLELLKHVRDTETSLLMKDFYEKSSINGGQVVLRIPAPPYADQGCTDNCSSEGNAH